MCVEQLISEYVDGDLSPAQARNLEEHFEVCAECRAILLEYYTLVTATHLLAAGPRAAGDFRQAVTDLRRRNCLGQARTSDLLA
jgi:anti-sigma factor RsiW